MKNTRMLLGHYKLNLKVHSCKLHNNKHIIPSTQITHTKIFVFIAALVFKLLNRKVLLINRNTIETVEKYKK